MTAMSAPRLASARVLAALLLRQAKHDRLYHRDIDGLAKGPKLQHLALHFAKYIGRLATAEPSPSKTHFVRTLTDFFIIALSASNALGLTSAQIAESLRRSKHIVQSVSGTNPVSAAQALALRLAPPVGRLAKACEALDHLEDVPFAADMRSAVVEILAILSQVFIEQRIAHRAAIIQRWQQIERHRVP